MRKLISKQLRPYFGLACVLSAAVFLSASCGTDYGPAPREPDALTNDESGPTSICIEKKTFSGCCSGKGGVQNIRGNKLLCRNGEKSPSCEGDVETRLNGCCSHHEGITTVDSGGIVYCASGEKSPSCEIFLQSCEAAAI